MDSAVDMKKRKRLAQLKAKAAATVQPVETGEAEFITPAEGISLLCLCFCPMMTLLVASRTEGISLLCLCFCPMMTLLVASRTEGISLLYLWGGHFPLPSVLRAHLQVGVVLPCRCCLESSLFWLVLRTC